MTSAVEEDVWVTTFTLLQRSASETLQLSRGTPRIKTWAVCEEGQRSTILFLSRGESSFTAMKKQRSTRGFYSLKTKQNQHEKVDCYKTMEVSGLDLEENVFIYSDSFSLRAAHVEAAGAETAGQAGPINPIDLWRNEMKLIWPSDHSWQKGGWWRNSNTSASVFWIHSFSVAFWELLLVLWSRHAFPAVWRTSLSEKSCSEVKVKLRVSQLEPRICLRFCLSDVCLVCWAGKLVSHGCLSAALLAWMTRIHLLAKTLDGSGLLHWCRCCWQNLPLFMT